MIAILKVLVITFLATSCLSVKSADNRKDSLNGLWQAQSLEINGETASDPVESIHVTFTNNRVFVQLDGRYSRGKEGLFKIDQSTSPKQIYVSSIDDPSQSVLGIYEVNDDTLKVCFTLDNNTNRPDKFETRPDSNKVLVVFKKLK